MRRRTKWMLGGALTLVLLGGLLATAWWFLHSRTLAERIEQLFAERFAGIGVLRIGGLRVVAHDQYEISDIVITKPRPLLGSEPEPLARMQRVTVVWDWSRMTPIAIDIAGVDVVLDYQRYRLLDAILTREAEVSEQEALQAPRDSAPRVRIPIAITISGRGEIPGALAAHAVSVQCTATGPMVTGVATATTTTPHGSATAALRMAFRTLDQRAAARSFEYRIDQGQAPAAALISAAMELGIFDEPGPAVRKWLPGDVTIDGTTIINTPKSGSFSGPLRASWAGGEAQAQLSLNRDLLVLQQLSISDPSLLVLDGSVHADLRAGTVRIDSTAWSHGPRLQIPEIVPMAGLRAVLPRLEASMSTRAGGGVPTATMRSLRADQGWLRIEDRPAGLRITGNELPLPLAQSFVPAWLSVRGGLASDSTAGGAALAVTFSATVPESVTIRVRHARIEAHGWALGPLDGVVRARPLALGWGVDVDALDSHVRWVPNSDGGTINADIASIQPLINRLAGPFALPDLRGSASGSLVTRFRGESWTIDAYPLSLRHAEIPDVIRGCDADGRLRMSWEPPRDGTNTGDMRLSAEGQLTTGAVRLPGFWMDLAARAPLVRLSTSIAAVGDQRVVTVARCAARAASPGGKPLADGWSAAMSGSIGLDDGRGHLEGTVDRVDLGWVMRHLPGAAQNLLSGEMACTFRADFDHFRPEVITGAIIPLGASVDFAAPLKINGLTGMVGFTLENR